MFNSFTKFKAVSFVPLKYKLNYSISEFINNVIYRKFLFTIIENNSSKIVIPRKNSKFGIVKEFDNFEILDPSKKIERPIISLNLCSNGIYIKKMWAPKNYKFLLLENEIPCTSLKWRIVIFFKPRSLRTRTITYL